MRITCALAAIFLLLGCKNTQQRINYTALGKVSVYSYGTWLEPNTLTIHNDSAYVLFAKNGKVKTVPLLPTEKSSIDSFLFIIKQKNYSKEYIDSNLSDGSHYEIRIPDQGKVKAIKLYGSRAPMELWLFSKYVAGVRQRVIATN
jgi:uncharacterized lipoprotein NlpE involved in copper resistance